MAHAGVEHEGPAWRIWSRDTRAVSHETGYQRSPHQRFPHVQILTIAELLQGKQAQYPRYAPTVTFRQASRRPKGADSQQVLL